MNFRFDGVLTLSLAIPIAAAIGIAFFSESEDEPACTDQRGCNEYIHLRDGLYVTNDGQMSRVTALNMRLTPQQAAFFEDPNSELKRVKRTILTVYGHSQAVECEFLEAIASEVLILFINRDDWVKTEGLKKPIGLCGSIKPVRKE